MEADTTVELREELRKAKQNLSEVIDECVFVERQRDHMEQQLTAELKERDRMITDSFSSMTSLIEYLSLLERRVILPALGSFSAVVSKVQDAATTRSSALEQVEVTLGAHNSSQLRGILAKMQPLVGELESDLRESLLERPAPFSMEEAYVLLRALLNEKDNLVQRIDETVFHLNNSVSKTRPTRSMSLTQSDEVRQLRHKVSALTQELQLRDEEKLDVAQRFAVIQKALERDGENMEELHRLRDTVERQKRTIEQLSQYNGSSDTAKLESLRPLGGNGVVVKNSNNNNEEDFDELIPQLKANELTIGALNKELSIWEENYRVLEKRSAKEREELLTELANARGKYREEKEECDAVLGRVTMELEQLVAENAQLKKRLRERHTKKKLQTNIL